ncbi:(2,3-dihydroxybenzoyl)adenylate synthase [Speluncibacter jeojiensis]|uniref:AMP-binding protein n=1 Tax=Speluncibacter jeojiensis TaxID=2710754 RepID=A0A9X4M0M2_9ACTN|nr:AMP-binding protein [Corynebacteriales bacterium D3-21]
MTGAAQPRTAPLDGVVEFPAEFAERYRTAGYWRGETLGALLRSTTARRPDATALHTTSGPMTYAELDRRADRFAAGLLELGLHPGDRAVVHLPSTPEFVVALFGMLRAGVVPVLCLPAHRQTEVIHLAELSGAAAYLIQDLDGGFDFRELAATVRERVPSVRHVVVVGDPGPFTAFDSVDADPRELPEVDPSSVAVLLVSGGTTGVPKLIPRTHDDYAYNTRTSAQISALTEDDVYLAALPAAHNFPLCCPGILGTVAVGGSVALLTDPSPESAFAAIERHGVTVTALVPALTRLWCAATEWEDVDLSTLRLLQVGGARLAEADAVQVRPALGAALQQVFGMAEGLLNYTRLDDADELVTTTQGRPLSDADEVRVVDADGNDVAPGEEGELLTRGPYTIRGYYRAAEHNTRSFTPDGFYRSGDLVRRLPSGHLVVTGRIKDVINRAGENVSAEEVEEHLALHPAVRQAAVVGLADDALGEKICAAVVVDGQTPSLPELRGFLQTKGLAAFKLPDAVHRVATLPLTAVGKIDRKALRALIG